MIPCLDIHTHHPAPRPAAVVAIIPGDFNPEPEQRYSVGIHPWDSFNSPSPETLSLLEKIASHPSIVAIGECGIDKLKGGPMFRQLQVIHRQIELSERLQKPLIIHDVKAHDVIVGLKRDLNPTQKWLVHGFRGKPTVARMLTDAGIYLSFGEKFNEESLMMTPRGMILAETDESLLSIEEIIANISKAVGKDMTEEITANTARFLGEEV